MATISMAGRRAGLPDSTVAAPYMGTFVGLYLGIQTSTPTGTINTIQPEWLSLSRVLHHAFHSLFLGLGLHPFIFCLGSGLESTSRPG
jgi:hypothetical protein